VLRCLVGISGIADELMALSDPQSRIAMGRGFNPEANQLFVFYLAHMIEAELTLVPMINGR
jgi:hypothetical protein